MTYRESAHYQEARRRDPDFEVRRLATFRKTMARKRAERAK